MSWQEGRTDAAVERILAAAADLFAEHGVGGTGMAQVAAAAGCSRATLYRYFENRRALQVAFAHLEARRIVDEVGRAVAHLEDPLERRVESVLETIEAVRRTPHLAAWLAPADAALLAEILEESAVVEELTAAFVGTTGRLAPIHPDLGRWVLRVILSFLTFPGSDRDEERRMVEAFVAPLLATRPA